MGLAASIPMFPGPSYTMGLAASILMFPGPSYTMGLAALSNRNCKSKTAVFKPELQLNTYIRDRTQRRNGNSTTEYCFRVQLSNGTSLNTGRLPRSTWKCTVRDGYLRSRDSVRAQESNDVKRN